MLEEGFTVKEG